MSDEFGPDFITVTAEDGTEIELELLDTLEHKGVRYMALYPAESEAEGEEEEVGIVLMKVIEEDGEELLSTLDSDEELEEIYDLFMEQIFSDAEDDGE